MARQDGTGRLDMDKVYGKRPKVTAEDFDGGDTIVVIVAEGRVVHLNDGSNKAVLAFREFPGKEFWPNVSSMKYLVEQYGDVPASWAGRPVPLQLKDSEFAGEVYENRVWVAAPELWESIFKAAGVKADGVSRAAPKLGKPTGAKMASAGRTAAKPAKRGKR